MDAANEAIQEIIEEIKSSPSDINQIKNRVAKKYRLQRVPGNSEILEHVPEEYLPLLLPLLRRKPIRTLSGVAVVAVMARPYPCPGNCIYCPKGDDAPQSYTGEEPAALRARNAGYDPYTQVMDRLKQLDSIGHPIEKVELIVMGGTFLAQPIEYQEEFVRSCIVAMNAYGDSKGRDATLQEVQHLNEKAKIRNVGITFETRPDFAREEHVDRMLELGVTRVELGVQSLSDAVYDKVNRGHTVDDVVRSTKTLKDAG
ncbi:MAG: radical SAM protein, partial [Candidatus Hydrothermarchaeales archaeon]